MTGPSFDVVTEEVDPYSSLLPLLDREHPLLFMRRGEGIAGLGEAARHRASLPTDMIAFVRS